MVLWLSQYMSTEGEVKIPNSFKMPCHETTEAKFLKIENYIPTIQNPKLRKGYCRKEIVTRQLQKESIAEIELRNWGCRTELAEIWLQKKILIIN